MNPDKIDEIVAFHRAKNEEIDARLADFRRIWAAGSDRDPFAELAFCILTPQYRARTCWPAVERLRGCDLFIAAAPGRSRGSWRKSDSGRGRRATSSQPWSSS